MGDDVGAEALRGDGCVAWAGEAAVVASAFLRELAHVLTDRPPSIYLPPPHVLPAGMRGWSNMSQYKCCQGYFDCCCFRAGSRVSCLIGRAFLCLRVCLSECLSVRLSFCLCV